MTDRSAHAGAEHASRTCCATRTWSTPRTATTRWPEFDENTASSICYTSGTTGNPKGAVYSHRSTLLHTYGLALPDAHGRRRHGRDPAGGADVPRQRLGHCRTPRRMVGAKLVFPGPHLDGKSLYELFETEKVTFSAGVPTVWLGLINFAQAEQAEVQHAASAR